MLADWATLCSLVSASSYQVSFKAGGGSNGVQPSGVGDSLLVFFGNL